MNCDAVIREISNYIDGDLDGPMMHEIEVHLADCKECTMIMRQTKLTVEIFYQIQPTDLPPEVHSRLHDTLRRKIHKTGN